MNIDNLHQKHHGLPGVGFSSGKNGQDGEGGNNVYFGYINEFFETIDMTADNLIRIATETSTGRAYTGIFSDTGDIPLYDTSHGGHFVEIMADKEYPGRYSYTFDASTNNMKMYVKADVAKIGRDVSGNNQPWNVGPDEIGNRWKDEVDGEQPFRPGIYPYVAYKGTLESIQEEDPSNHANIRPGNYNLSQSDLNGFELFSIKTSSATYQFAYKDGVTKTFDPSVYSGFEDSLSHSIDEPTIAEVGIAYAHEDDPSVLKVDFIKYSEEISEQIEVLDKLDRSIVAGDVIYFYKDKGDFEINETVRYMTVITEALEGCSYQDLIDAAVEVNPFTFKFIDTVNKDATDYLYSTLPSVAGYYDAVEQSKDVSIYGRNMVNMLDCLGDDTALQTGIMSKSSNDLDMLRLQTTTDAGLTIRSEHVAGGGRHDVSVNIDTGSAKMLKISNAYFRNTNIGNLESAGILTPVNMVLDDRQVIHSATIDDYNPDDRTFRFDKSQFFDSNVKHWHAGAICVTYDQRTGMKPSTAVALQSVAQKTRTYSWNEDSEEMSFTLTDDFGIYTAHIITLWASVNGGFRHYSDKLLARYDTSEAAYMLSGLTKAETPVDP